MGSGLTDLSVELKSISKQIKHFQKNQDEMNISYVLLTMVMTSRSLTNLLINKLNQNESLQVNNNERSNIF